MLRNRYRRWLRSKSGFATPARKRRAFSPLNWEVLEDRCVLTLFSVGPGLAYTSLGAVPFETLGPGDTVQVHWQPTAYHEKILISTSGTADKPIRIEGVPGPNGELPVIDGQNATTRSQTSYPFAATQDRGLVTVTRDTRNPFGFKPSYINIERLEIRNANKDFTFTDAQGATRTYTDNAASIFVERGQHITVRGCTITGSGNGLFVASGDEEAVVSRDILVEGNRFEGNGNVGSDRHHNVYTAAIGIIFQFNYFGELRAGSNGIGLKDRSAGTIIRYNWIAGGARLLDLVDAEDSPTVVAQEPSYREAFVYGNIFKDGAEDAGNLIRYGGDSGVTTNYRKGTLYFYNNTVIVQTNEQQRFNTTLLQLDTNDENVDLRNNILFVEAATPGSTPTTFSLMSSFGNATVGVNWVSPGWQTSTAFGGFQGTITGTGNIIGGPANEPGFVNLAANDVHLLSTSPSVDVGEPIAPAAETNPVVRHYVSPQSNATRPVRGAAADLGAFEFIVALPVLFVDKNNTTGVADGTAAKPYATVQVAINAAPADAIIKVAKGTYTENVVVPSKNLQLLGGFVGGSTAGYMGGQAGDFAIAAPTANITKIVGTASEPVMLLQNITARAIVIDGFTITGGHNGIYVVGDFEQFADVTIARNIIENNGPAELQPGGGTYSYFGGGIYSSNATITIANNIVRNNNANRGGGIFVSSQTDFSITGNLIENNSGYDDHGGGAVLVPLPQAAPGSGLFSGNEIRGNVASKAYNYGWGGGMLITGNDDPSALRPIRLSHNVWSGNLAPSIGGALFVDNGATAVLDHELMYDNNTNASGGGGAIFLDGTSDGIGSSLTILNSTIADNHSVSQDGNGVYVLEFSTLYVSNSIFWGNTDDFFKDDSSVITVNYSNTQEAWPGMGNLSTDPLFANAAAHNYRLKSTGGRFDAAANGGAGGFVLDAVDSPLIDAGNPASPFALEPAPNGGRINMGFDGNTPQASRSVSTNPGQVQFSSATSSVAEDGGIATITVTRTGGSDGTITVQVSMTGGSALSGSDFTPPASTTLTFAPGIISQSLSIPITNDELVEGDETITLSLQNATGGATLGTQVNATLTITDNDVTANPGQLQFGSATYEFAETAGNASVIITRTGGSSGAVAVQYVVAIPASVALKYRATVGVDFQGSLSGTVSFAEGEMQKTLTFPLLADNLVEATEFFTVELNDATGGATLGSLMKTTVGIVDTNTPVVPNSTPNVEVLQAAGSAFGKSAEHYRDFVTKAYGQFLSRIPDAEGINYWVTLMQLYETSSHSQGLRQEQIEAGFLDSPEYLGRYGGVGDAWVAGIYRDLLNREADASGLQFWRAQLAAGLSPMQLALGFTISLERLQNRIQETYQTLLGRSADAGGLAAWVAVFQSGGTTEDINSGFVGSPEYYAKPSGAAGNPARWVREAYLDILFRPARTGELGFWLNYLQS